MPSHLKTTSPTPSTINHQQTNFLLNESQYTEALNLYRSSNLKRIDICRSLGIDYRGFTYFLKSRHPELLSRHRVNPLTGGNKQRKKEAENKYRKAVALAENSELTYKEIADITEVSIKGLTSHIQKYHRALMLKRQGLEISKRAAKTYRTRNRAAGQTSLGLTKYKDAIEACDSIKYISLSVSEIAKKFGFTPSALLTRLRNHFPEITERREKIRKELGYTDNSQRGARKSTMEQYAAAIELLKTTDKTIAQAAEECNVTYAGLRTHLLQYHKDVVAQRREKIEKAKGNKTAGTLNGNGSISKPDPEMTAHYAEAVKLYKEGKLNLKEIAEKTGVSYPGLKYHIRRWHNE